ncbi:MAG: ApaG domain [Candidatus Methylacidiphilales bacterium]|nr:ApaG domain [Candidatus Methylacidiphilales bacterium]
MTPPDVGWGMADATPKPRELPGLTAAVDRVECVPASDAPPHRPHKFAYHISIHNHSLRVVTITGRKWVLTNAKGHKLVVQGDGVVGQFPRLTPGDSFRYNSYHLVDSTSTAEGAYTARDEDGETLLIRIPAFPLTVDPASP